MTPSESSGVEPSQEPSIKSKIAIPLYQVVGEEFLSEKQMKRYLSKIKRVKEVRRTPEDSEEIATNTA